MNMRLELRMVAEDEDGQDVCAAHARKVNEDGHGWRYAWMDDPDSDLAAAYRAIGMTTDMLMVCTLCSSPCPRERCPLWNKGKRAPTFEEVERERIRLGEGQ